MKSRALTGTLLLLASLQSACRERPASQLLVVVGTDIAVGSGRLETVELLVQDRDGRVDRGRSRVVVSNTPTPPLTVAIPFSFGVVPEGDDARRGVRVTVSASFQGTGRRDAVQLTAITGFIEGKKLVLPMFLQQRCINVTDCADGLTCIDGVCQSALRPTNTLEEAPPNAAVDLMSALDARAPSDASQGGLDVHDVNMVDTASGDAGVDVGAPDLGAPDAGFDSGFDGGFDSGFDAGAPDAAMPDAGPADVPNDRIVLGPDPGAYLTAPASFSLLSSRMPRIRAKVTLPNVQRVYVEMAPAGGQTLQREMSRAQGNSVGWELNNFIFGAGTWWYRLVVEHGNVRSVGNKRWFLAPAAAMQGDGVGFRTYLDYDADGFADLVAGARNVASPNPSNETRLQWGFRAGTMAPPMQPFPAGNPNDMAVGPSDIAALGDLNGDGYGDFAASAGDRSRVSVIYGNTLRNGLLNTYELIPTNGEALGQSLGATDFDGDGYADALVSMRAASNPNSYGALLHFGAMQPGVGQMTVPTGCMADAGQPVEQVTLTGLGDLDGDGYGDFAMGAVLMAPLPNNAQPVTVYFGQPRPAPFQCPMPERLNAPMALGLGFGNAIAALGDVNGDGRADLGVLSHEALFTYTQVSTGRQFVAQSTPFATQTWCAGAIGSGALSARLVGTGDLDGDGFGDAAVAFRSGCLVLFRGSSGGLQFAMALRGPGGGPAPSLAEAVSPVGDFNGDGRTDLGTTALLDLMGERQVFVYDGATVFTTPASVWEQREMSARFAEFGDVLSH
ncbi:MAG: VCBS repeat-containing protein [Myxococcales bacterium]|nr:VCBS repeat-containing protein [Myxococcales bacterium]